MFISCIFCLLSNSFKLTLSSSKENHHRMTCVPCFLDRKEDMKITLRINNLCIKLHKKITIYAITQDHFLY